MFSRESLIFLLSSLISLTLIYYKIPTRVLQQIIITLLIAILLFFNRFISSKIRTLLVGWGRLVLLFLIATIVQLVVISTGGFLSPFLILLHLFIIGTSFLLNVRASASFLVFSLVVLVANIWLNHNLFLLFKDDPFSITLYFVSFIVIIPLAQLLSKNYYIKDVLSKILSENLYLGQQREESIVQNLNELVLVTDKNLKILSINQAVEQTVKMLATQILGSSLFDILPIRYKGKDKPSPQNLSIEQILADKTTRIIDDFSLNRSGMESMPIRIQIHPVVDLKNEVSQLVFVLKDRRPEHIYSEIHRDLDQAHKKHQAIFDEFIKTIEQSKLNNLKLKAELLRKIEEDLLIAQEIENHPIKENISFPDVAELCRNALALKKEFADSLSVATQFSLPVEESAEKSLLTLKDQQVSTQALRVSDFSVPIDPRWLQVILEKLLDLAILLASGQKSATVRILLSRKDVKTINVEVSSSYPAVPNKLQGEFLSQYFGSLEKETNLRLGSGLERFIAQTTADQLKLPLLIRSLQNPARLSFILELSKDRTFTHSPS